ncbi:hypothetical protein Salat_1646500 [Sesamum alatum]|uniref:Uncharacterized protein n=1 Tax=Sesamum alatum TaxID=300844 RepID=A0AAE1Y7A5_9LAMI|nr:hypothetical protein Salat_1646500 [Sesamum alatum]
MPTKQQDLKGLLNKKRTNDTKRGRAEETNPDDVGNAPLEFGDGGSHAGAIEEPNEARTAQPQDPPAAQDHIPEGNAMSGLAIDEDPEGREAADSPQLGGDSKDSEEADTNPVKTICVFVPNTDSE